MEDEILKKLIENYKLSEKEHKIVLEQLKKDLFANEGTKKSPSILFVVGQPGCGKTTFIKNGELSEYIIINSDDYRSLSKYSKEILEKYPTQYAKLTNFDAHLWGDELFSFAIQNGYSVLREKAPTDYRLLDLIKTIPQDYDIVIYVVVAGSLSSLLATRERYEKEILERNDAKLSNIESHNKCYGLLPDFISRCLSLKVKVNYIVPTGNQFKIIPVRDDYLDLLQKFRKESNKRACVDYNNRMNHIKRNMINRNASQDQFDELKKIEGVYFEIINGNEDEEIT